MRPEKLFLADMVRACRAVGLFIAGMDEAAFRQSELHQSAVLQKLTEIGEAASRLSAEFRDEHPEIEWRDIVAFRNFAVHAYFSVNWSIVWATAVHDVPPLLKSLSVLPETEDSDEEA